MLVSYLRQAPLFPTLIITAGAAGLLTLSVLFGDDLAFRHLYSKAPPRLVSEGLTLLGGGVLGVFSLLWLSRRLLFIWLAFVAGWLSTGLITWSGKKLLCPACLRPAAHFPAQSLPADYPLRHGAGMPSGHSAEAALAVLALAAAYPRLRLLQVSLAVLAVSVALSRVWLAQHYPSQAGAGLLVGLFSFLFWDFLLFAYRRQLQNRRDVEL